jgi:hypothetical protein
MRAADLLRNKFGISQLYKHSVEVDGEVVLEVFWHPLTIAERESIQKKSDSDDANDFALGMMIQKALDAEGKRLFSDGDKPALRREVEASVLQDIQLAMLNSGTESKVEEAKADLKSSWFFVFFLAKELGMTVTALTRELTQEELVGWAAFYELKSEEEEKAMERARKTAQSKARR